MYPMLLPPLHWEDRSLQDTVEYKKQQWTLKVHMLDETVKMVMVDDSKTVMNMLMTICAWIGITNYDKYLLVWEIMEEKEEEVTGTLKKDETLLRDEKKMEKLKQKLHMNDELNWLDHGWTLREQGIDNNETLLLRCKFYSNQNARNDILNGSHPISFDKACEFASYQCPIQFGPHNEQKHKLGFLELKDFLPKEYIKQKGERKIFMTHKNCGNMSEIEAKVRYVKFVCSLKTYGVSFFPVKEKMKGKNKLVLQLLGITKECVMRVDEETKEDFGDYQDGYYSVQTTVGEQIAQLIASYIDIILKKKKSKDHFGLEGDEESTMLEDSVSPKKLSVLKQQFNHVGKAELGSVALPAIMRTGAGEPENFQVGTMPQAQLQITNGQMHQGHIASPGDPANTDYTAMDCAVTTISSNLVEMSKGVKLLAVLMEDKGGNRWQLLQAAKNLPHQNLLQAAGLVGQTSGELLQQTRESDTDPWFQSQDMLMQLAKAVASATAVLVLKAKNVAQKMEDLALQMITAATQFTLSTSQLVACTKEQLIEAGKLVAKSAEGCVEASRAATSDDQLLKQMGMAATAITQALNDLLQHIKQHTTGGQPISQCGGRDLENSCKLLSTAKILADATTKMVETVKGAVAYPDSEEQQQWLREVAEELHVATNAAAQNAIKKKLVDKLKHAAKQTAVSTTQTIAAVQHAASSNKNPTAQLQLVQSCKVVAEQIPMLVQGVRGSQSQPDSPSAQLALIAASQNFLQAQEVCGPLEMIDSALGLMQSLERDLQEAKAAACDSKLKPLPGETMEKCTQDLGNSTKAVSSAIAHLLGEVAQGNDPSHSHPLRHLS
ncbi:talihypothetical protein [Limosa lapponica baueri]|uniref:FERM domain-containing protein n=1 Tax=Limosa lapponica baueri TaxID=1758121 RepID=A0A2I0TTL7_LIMLA|nr:talihypothetical protein [Limosa lapponica baueri]